MRNTAEIVPVMLEINGAHKSGSGTIVRDVVSLASLTGQEVHLRNIRAKRRSPGLRPQHVTAVKAVSELCDGEVHGAEVGSSEITYSPGDRSFGGEFTWDIGTAGSATMLAFTILPAAFFALTPSKHVIIGGLFQDFAPSAFHFKQVFLPILRAMGADVRLEMVQPGYVPRGGGRIHLQVTNVGNCLQPLNLQTPGEVTQVNGIALSSRLEDREVSARMAEACRTVLSHAGYPADIDIIYDTEQTPAFRSVAVQPGAALAIWAETSTGFRIGADRAGARGRSSESIGKYTANMLLKDLGTNAAVDRFLADQIIPYAALAKGTSRITIPHMTDHVETRIWLAEEMLGATIDVRQNQLIIRGTGFQNRR